MYSLMYMIYLLYVADWVRLVYIYSAYCYFTLWTRFSDLLNIKCLVNTNVVFISPLHYIYLVSKKLSSFLVWITICE